MAAVSAAAVTGFEASGALAAYEGFDYAAGTSLVGQNGGTGFAGAWGTTGGAATIQSPGMTYDSLVTSGNGLFVDGSAGSVAIFRDLVSPRGADGTTTWISLTHVRTGPEGGTASPTGGPSYLRPVNLALFDAGTERFALGEGTRTTGDEDVWGIVARGSVSNPATVWTDDTIEVDSFALLRIDHGVGDVDTAYLWINPSLLLEPSTLTADATTTTNFTFNRIRPFAGNPSGVNPAAQGLIDEIRIGDTFFDVAPVPEPSTYALLGMGALAFAFGFRRRK